MKSLPVIFDLPVWKGRDWSADLWSGKAFSLFFFPAELGHFILEFIASPVNTNKSNWLKVRAQWNVRSCDATSRDCLKEAKICRTKTTAADFDTDPDHKQGETVAWSPKQAPSSTDLLTHGRRRSNLLIIRKQSSHDPTDYISHLFLHIRDLLFCNNRSWSDENDFFTSARSDCLPALQQCPCW